MTDQPVVSEDSDSPPLCGGCGVACVGGYACSVDPKTQRKYNFRCHGCHQREYWQEYVQTRILRTKLLTDAAIEEVLRQSHSDRKSRRPIRASAETLTEVIAANNALRCAAKYFEQVVWYNGLQPLVRACKVHGQRVGTRQLKWLVWAGAGRVLITLEDPREHHSLTLITTEDGTESHIGVQGVEGTLAKTLALVDLAVALWRGKRRPPVKADEQVRYLF